jgi:hypothetical protein
MQDESSDAPRLEASRSSAEASDKLEIVGTGFSRQDPVRLTIGDDNQFLSTTQTDALGRFVAETRVPPDVPFGVQPIAAVDARGSSATSAVLVRWGGWPPLVAFTVGRPGPRPGEVTFSVSLRNRSDYVLERVRVVLVDPEGASFVTGDPAPEREGQTVVWELATIDRGVVGPFQATYSVRDAVVGHARVDFRHRRPYGCSGDECSPAFVGETTSDSTPVYPAD